MTVDVAEVHADAAWRVLRGSLGTRVEVHHLLASVLTDRLAHCGFAHRGPLLRGLSDRLGGLVHPGLLAATLRAVDIILDTPAPVRNNARDLFIAHLTESPPS